MSGVVLLAIAVLGAAYSSMVLRAAPTRRDNQLFFAIAILDVAMVAWRGANVLSGHTLIERACVLPCSMGTTVLATLSVEFLWRFPGGERSPRALRALTIAMAAAAVAIMAFTNAGAGAAHAAISFGYFAPITVIICAVGVRAWRRTRTVGVRLIVAALLFRWVYGFCAYIIGEATGTLEVLLWIETTAAVLVSFVVIGQGILRDELFRVRGAAAEVMGATVFGTLVLGLTAGAVHLILTYAPAGPERELALIGASVVPLALVAAGRALYPRIETGVLASLDERRALRLELTEPLSEDPDQAIAEGAARLRTITGSDRVRFLPAEALPAATTEALARDADHELRGAAAAPHCLLVGVKGGGAWAIDGGAIDRDTLLVARQVARDVGHALEHRAMLGELEGTRRLAALGQFAAAIAHDIRTPLTSVSMNVQILRRKAQARELPASDMEYFDIALDELGRLERSVAQILDYAKPVRLDASAVDVRELVDDAARGLAPVYATRGVVLRAEHEGALPAVAGDAQRLRQVLTNLVDNAAVASKDGCAVTLRTRADDGHVVIDVEDRGTGIRADDLGKIFEPFYTTRPDGTGLGLAICQKLVRAHGGELRVRSQEGAGSTFSVVLPVPAMAASLPR